MSCNASSKFKPFDAMQGLTVESAVQASAS